MTCRIIRTNRIIINFHKDQINVHHIILKNSSIIVIVLLFNCSVVGNFHYNPVIVTTNNLRVIAIL